MPQNLYIYDWRDLSVYPENAVVEGPNAIAQMMFHLISIVRGELLFLNKN